MSDSDKNAIHISPAGESWDVETESKTLGTAGSREEAVEIAKTEAVPEEASAIIIHSSEGLVEKELEVPKAETADETP